MPGGSTSLRSLRELRLGKPLRCEGCLAEAHGAKADTARLELIGAIAQLGERVLCKHEVVGSIPSGSTIRASALEWFRSSM